MSKQNNLHLHCEEEEEGREDDGKMILRPVQASTLSLEGSLNTVTDLTPKDRSSILFRGNDFLIHYSSNIGSGSHVRLYIRGMEPMTLGIKRPKRECGYPAPIFTVVQNVLTVSSTLLYVFIY